MPNLLARRHLFVIASSQQDPLYISALPPDRLAYTCELPSQHEATNPVEAPGGRARSPHVWPFVRHRPLTLGDTAPQQS
jgi:hypothetical protein